MTDKKWEKHPGYYVGQRVTVCILDPGNRFNLNDEGVVTALVKEWNDYACQVLIPGKGLFYFRNKEVVDADWLWQRFLNMEEVGLVRRYERDDGTTGWLLTETGKDVHAGAVMEVN